MSASRISPVDLAVRVERLRALASMGSVADCDDNALAESPFARRFSDDRRWYLSGDAGSLDDDGYFRFLSRDET